MAGEEGEGSGDDLNVLGLQLTLRVSFFGAHASNERAYPMLYLCGSAIVSSIVMYVPTGATREFNAAEIGALAHLCKAYLEAFPTLEALLAKYPNRSESPGC